MKQYLIYETTNNITNQRYRGAHEAASSLGNGPGEYLGSGGRLLIDVEIYGKKNFTVKELDDTATNSEELYWLEKNVYVTQEWVDREDTYNDVIGGHRPPTLNELRPHVRERKLKRMREVAKERIGIPRTDETKAKISKANAGENNGMHPSNGHSHTPEFCESQRQRMLGNTLGRDWETNPWTEEESKESSNRLIEQYASGKRKSQKGTSRSNKGHTYLTKNGKAISVPNHQLQEYLDDGWEKGNGRRGSRGKNRGYTHINNGIQNKSVSPDKLQEYLDNGWELGRIKRNKKYRWIHNGIERKKVQFDKLQEYLDNGWQEGYLVLKKHTSVNKGKICIHKNKTKKYILKKDLSKWLDKGWAEGGYIIGPRKKK